MKTKKLESGILCVETNKAIASPSQLYAATNRSIPWFAPISKSVVDAIPLRARRKTPCSEGERGLDVWLSVSGASPRGGCDPSSVRLGTYLFSLSETMAGKYLPRAKRKIPRSTSSSAKAKLRVRGQAFSARAA